MISATALARRLKTRSAVACAWLVVVGVLGTVGRVLEPRVTLVIFEFAEKPPPAKSTVSPAAVLAIGSLVNELFNVTDGPGTSRPIRRAWPQGWS